MRRILVASLKGHARRFVAGMIAIVLGVGFVSAILIAMDSGKAGIDKAVGDQYSKADLVVSNDQAPILGKTAAKLSKVDGVAAVYVVSSASARVTFPDKKSESTGIGAIPADEGLRWHSLVEGRYPASTSEFAISKKLATSKGISVGDTLRMASFDERRRASKTRAVKVSGIVDQGSLLLGTEVFTTEDGVAAMNDGNPSGDVLVRLNPDADFTKVAPALHKVAVAEAKAADAMPDKVVVRSAPDQVTHLVSGMTGGVDIMGRLLLGFAAIAMFVAMLVVANTFTIVIAQRARELALFRCVGAAKSQVFRAVVVEALVIGLAASVVGIAVGLGIAQLAVTLLQNYLGDQFPLSTLTIAPMAVAIPVVIGMLTTLVAALAPARRATKVPPLAALRPEAGLGVRTRAGAARLGLGLLLLLAGAGLLAVGLLGSLKLYGLLFGVAGGVLSFLGVLLFGPILTPAIVRVLGLIARRAGVPGNVSADNAVRNPRRTAATAAALLVGVTLITLLTVGAATVQTTSDRTLDRAFPMDIFVRVPVMDISSVPEDSQAANRPALPDSAVSAVGQVDGVLAVAPLRSALVTIANVPNEGGWMPSAYGLDPAQATKALRNPRPIVGLRPGVAVLSPTLAEAAKVKDGKQITLKTKSGSVTMRVKIVNFEGTPDLIITNADLSKLAPDASQVGLWGRVANGTDMTALMSGVEKAISGTPDAQIEGSAAQRALYNKIIDVMLLVAVGLLAISVAIALVGVGNTLSLSVLERIRENALLRALGLTRGQLRSTLAIEALLIAGAAVVIGLVLGIAYGFLGASTLFQGANGVEEVVLAIPWGRLGLIALVALGAGVLASILPARRAVRTPPSAALSAE